MNNPTLYIVDDCDRIDNTEIDDIEIGHLDWIKERAVSRAKSRDIPQIIYKLVPVIEISLEITTKVISKEISQ